MLEKAIKAIKLRKARKTRNARKSRNREMGKRKVKRDEETILVIDNIFKKGRAMLNYYYGGSLVKALQAVYPDVPFQIEKFKTFHVVTNTAKVFFLLFTSYFLSRLSFKIPSLSSLLSSLFSSLF